MLELLLSLPTIPQVLGSLLGDLVLQSLRSAHLVVSSPHTPMKCQHLAPWDCLVHLVASGVECGPSVSALQVSSLKMPSPLPEWIPAGQSGCMALSH